MKTHALTIKNKAKNPKNVRNCERSAKWAGGYSWLTCCKSILTLLMLTEAIGPLVRVNVPGFIVGRFSGDPSLAGFG
jgi:hypothetical protein